MYVINRHDSILISLDQIMYSKTCDCLILEYMFWRDTFIHLILKFNIKSLNENIHIMYKYTYNENIYTYMYSIYNKL